jgi:sensor histidine kinase YesM
LINAMFAGWAPATHNFIYYFVYSAGFSLANWLYFYIIGKYLGWQKNPEKTLIIAILGVIPVNALVYLNLNLFFRVIVGSQDLRTFLSQINPLEYTLVILFALLVALIIIIGHFFKAVRMEKEKSEELKIQNEQIKFESLKQQFDPHFLFNNLNVLTALISEDAERAEAYTLALSDIYKYVLDQKDQSLVPLKEELDFAKKYLELLKMRYEDDLQFQIKGQINNTHQIPPLSLQVLLENAVKHNSITSQHPLNIIIEINDNTLIITNNINSKKTTSGKGFGLFNLRKRYRLLTDNNIIINADNHHFSVTLPLL